MGAINCLATHVLQNTLFCVQKKTHTGLEQLEGIIYKDVYYTILDFI